MNADRVDYRQLVLGKFRKTASSLLLLFSVCQVVLYRLVEHPPFPTLPPSVPFLVIGGVVLSISAGFLKGLENQFLGWEREESPASTRDKMAGNNEWLLNNSTDAIALVDREGKIQFWNRGAEILFHLDSEEAAGEPFFNLFSDSKAGKVEFQWISEMVDKNASLNNHETTCIHPERGIMHVALTATRLTDQQKQPNGMALIIRDISRSKRREDWLNQRYENLNRQVLERTDELTSKLEELNQVNNELQQLDQTRSEFVSVVSHQIRAPLTNMNGAVQRMQADCAAINPTCSRMMVVIEEQILRLDRLVKDVLNAIGIEAGSISLQREPISVMPLVNQAVEQFQVGNEARRIDFQDKPGLPLIFADRDRTIDVLTNLLDNADKYSPAGGKIQIDVRADQSEVTLSVKDMGPGIHVEDFTRIFEKFYRSEKGDSQSAYGYGLGLYVCKQMVGAQGGRIWAANDKKGGAVISFTVPVWQEQND